MAFSYSAALLRGTRSIVLPKGLFNPKHGQPTVSATAFVRYVEDPCCLYKVCVSPWHSMRETVITWQKEQDAIRSKCTTKTHGQELQNYQGERQYAIAVRGRRSQAWHGRLVNISYQEEWLCIAMNRHTPSAINEGIEGGKNSLLFILRITASEQK